MPGDHSSVWEFLFPTHDYPMPMAMAALRCAAGGPDAPLFAQAARRWAAAARAEAESWPAGQVRYAEHYGRLIVYLAEHARLAGEPAYRALAETLAAQAVQRLDAGSLLLGRTNADWYDAIDGVGFLALALLHLEAPDPATLDLFSAARARAHDSPSAVATGPARSASGPGRPARPGRLQLAHRRPRPG